MPPIYCLLVMKERIRQIMESMHMTQQVFAQFIGMSPASLSSIFNDRTKPTLNIVEAIKLKIPNINTDWLMFGHGTMFMNDNEPSSGPQEPSSGSSGGLFDGVPPITDLFSSASPTPQGTVRQVPSNNGVKSTHPNSAFEEVKNADKSPRRVVEIRVFYDDQTWESFSPSKK